MSLHKFLVLALNYKQSFQSFKLNLIKRGYNELEIDDNINQALSNNSQIFKQEKQKTYASNSFGAFN